MSQAQIHIYCKPPAPATATFDDLRFKKIKIDDSVFINIFMDAGFDPTIDAERSCPTGMKFLDGFVLVEDEDEFRDDWDIIDYTKVKCSINLQPTVDHLDQTDDEKIKIKNIAKAYFSNLLGLKEIPYILDGEDMKIVEKLLPPKIDKLTNETYNYCADKLDDGRNIVRIFGGEYSDRVNELLSKLDPSVLVPRRREIETF